jgi:hypothetical protein
MAEFEATDDFIAAMTEVDYLLRSAGNNQADAAAYNVLNKATILLLSAKLEAFIEQIVEEYCFSLTKKQLPSERVPVRIRLSATQRLLSDEFLIALDRLKETKVVPALEAIGQLWHRGTMPGEIAVDCRFAYGKHGEKEVRRLFQRLGVEDIFESCKIIEDSQSYATPDTKSELSMASDVNAIIGYRNYIIHNDGTPSVTHDQLDRYRRYLLKFVRRVDDFMAQCSRAIS